MIEKNHFVNEKMTFVNKKQPFVKKNQKKIRKSLLFEKYTLYLQSEFLDKSDTNVMNIK